MMKNVTCVSFHVSDGSILARGRTVGLGQEEEPFDEMSC